MTWEKKCNWEQFKAILGHLKLFFCFTPSHMEKKYKVVLYKKKRSLVAAEKDWAMKLKNITKESYSCILKYLKIIFKLDNLWCISIFKELSLFFKLFFRI